MIVNGLFSKRASTLSSYSGDMGELLGGVRSSTGVSVSPSKAVEIPSVYAAVKIIAESIRVMPLKVMRADGDVSAPDPQSRLWKLLHDKPNEVMDAGSVWELITAHLALRGNAYLWKETDRAGRVVGLWPLDPSLVSVGVVRRPGGWNKIFELSASADDPFPSAADQDEIVHFKGFGTSNWVGLSPIGALRELWGQAKAEEAYQGHLLANNAIPSGILTTEHKMTDEAAQRLVARWQAANAGMRNAGKTAVLEEGLTWQQTSLSVADQQFMEQRRMTRQDVALVYRIPAAMMMSSEGGNLHYTSNESNGINFVTYTLMPWMRRIEEALQADEHLPWTFTGPIPGVLFPKFNADAFMRMDTKGRHEAYKLAIDAGWLTKNEVRLLENREPKEGGDELPKPPELAPAEEEEPEEEPQQPPLQLVQENGNGDMRTRDLLALANRLKPPAQPIHFERGAITVNTPPVNVEAPNVNVEPTQVTVESPDVTVNMPDDKPRRVVRDPDTNQITGLVPGDE